MVMYRDELNLAIYTGRYARVRVRITQPFPFRGAEVDTRRGCRL